MTADAASGFSGRSGRLRDPRRFGRRVGKRRSHVRVARRGGDPLPALRAAETAGKPYRAVFFVRDPRDVVTQAYLDRVGRRRTLDQSLDDDVFDDDLIDREIDAFTAAATAANLGELLPQLGTVSGRSSRPPSIRKPTSTRRARSRRACVSSRRARTKTCASCASRTCSSHRTRASNFSGGGSGYTNAPTSTPSPTPASARRPIGRRTDARGRRPARGACHFTARNAARFDEAHGALRPRARVPRPRGPTRSMLRVDGTSFLLATFSQ